MWSHVVGNHRHPVLFFQTSGKRVGSVQGVVKELIIGRSELDEQDSRDRRFRLAEIADRLRHPVLEHPEVVLLEAGNKLPILGRYQHIQVD